MKSFSLNAIILLVEGELLLERKLDTSSQSTDNQKPLPNKGFWRALSSNL